jgi:hypothetical protein
MTSPLWYIEVTEALTSCVERSRVLSTLGTNSYLAGCRNYDRTKSIEICLQLYIVKKMRILFSGKDCFAQIAFRGPILLVLVICPVSNDVA